MSPNAVCVGIVIPKQTKLIMLPSKLVQPEWPKIPALELKKSVVLLKVRSSKTHTQKTPSCQSDRKTITDPNVQIKSLLESSVTVNDKVNVLSYLSWVSLHNYAYISLVPSNSFLLSVFWGGKKKLY